MVTLRGDRAFQPPVIGILRGTDAVFFSELMRASFDQGLDALEITINTPDAEKIVAANRHRVPGGKFLGMGTIRTLDEAQKALDAGAMFFVTPNLDIRVIEFAVKHDIPVVAGGLTPTEVYTAWQAGADMVKVFPCDAVGGPHYIRQLLGPFNDLKLAAVGGVSTGNLHDYFTAGAASVGVGSSLFGRRALEEKNIPLLMVNVKNFIEKAALSQEASMNSIFVK